jgi:PAS domain S-box-containing protein
MRLRTRITLTILVASILPLAVTGIAVMVLITDLVGSVAIGSNQRLASAGAEELSGYFEARSSELRIYANAPAIRSMDWQRAGPFLADELSRNAPAYEKLLLARPDGSYFLAGKQGNPARHGRQTIDNLDPQSDLLRLGDHDFWHQVSQAGRDEVFITEPLFSPTTGARQIVIYVPVRHQGNVVGVVGGAVAAEQFQHGIDTLRSNLFSVSPESRIAVVSAGGAYVCHWDASRLVQPVRDEQGLPVRGEDGLFVSKPMTLAQEPVPELAALAGPASRGLEASATFKDRQSGRTMIAFTAPIQHAPGHALLLVVPGDVVTAPIRQVRWFLLALLAAVAVMAVLSSLALVRGLIVPLRQLSRVAADIASGRFDTPLPPAQPDELGELTRTFGHMAGSLQARQRQSRERNESLARMNDRLQQQISERVLVEQELRTQRDFAESLVQTAHAMVCVTDADGRITRLNEFAQSHTGYGPADYEGRFLWDVLALPERREILQDIVVKIMAGLGAPSGESTLVAADGRRLLVRWYCSVLREPDGQARGLLAIGHDVTELREKEEQLRQVQKLEAVGQLAGGVAHDFNNILTVVQGNAELLRRDLVAPSPTARAVEQIIQASRRAADLTRKLLTFARKGRYQTVTLDMHAVIEDVVDLVRVTIGRRITLRLELRAEHHVLPADFDQIEHALLNLAINARNAIDGPGEIVIETGNVALDEPIDAGAYCVAPGHYLSLAVRDTGCGMSPAVRQRVFEPFFTTKGPGKGTGLGLPSVYGCVKNHHGYIDVQSEPGQGTCFTILLPLGVSDPQNDLPPLSGPSAEAPVVLVAHQEEAGREAVAGALHEAGYRVGAYGRLGDLAVACGKYHRQVEMAIIDCGWSSELIREAALNLRRCRADLPLVLLCTVEQASIEPALHAQVAAAEVLVKPCSMDELKAVVREVAASRKAYDPDAPQTSTP